MRSDSEEEESDHEDKPWSEIPPHPYTVNGLLSA
jgi:hypothetical protein